MSQLLDQAVQFVSQNKGLVSLTFLTAYVAKQLVPYSSDKHNFVDLRASGDKINIFDNFIVNKQGLWLFTHTWHTTQKPQGVIYLIHGFGEHIFRYEWFAQQMNNAGYTVIALDHQGHGQSQGDRTYIENFDDYIDDVIQFIQHYTVQYTQYNNVPHYIVGHSMGGLIAYHTMQYIANNKPINVRINGTVLSAPALFFDPTTVSPVQRILSQLFNKWLPKMPVRKLPLTTLSTIELTREQYKQDILVHRDGMTARWANEATRKIIEAGNTFSNVEWSFLVLHGTGDEIVSIKGSQQLYNRARSSDKYIKQFDNNGHEVHNDTQRQIFVNEILNYTNKRNKVFSSSNNSADSRKSFTPASH